MIFKALANAAVMLGLLAVSGCDRLKSTAAKQEAARNAFTAPEGEISPHFQKVVSRLDVGGKMVEFHDHEGRREMYIELAKAMLGTVPDMDARGIDVEGLVDASGVAQAAASGRSIRRDGDAWLMRHYGYHPSGDGGLAGLFGAEPLAFRSPGLMPASTDLVVETRLDASVLPALIQRMARAFGHGAAADGFLGEQVPGAGDLKGLLERTKLHVILGMDVSYWSAATGAGSPMDLYLRIEGGKELFELLRPGLEAKFGKPRDFAGRHGWGLGPMTSKTLRNAFLSIDGEGVLTLVSRPEYLTFVETAKMKLGEWKEYQAATDHFPESGNVLLYVSPQLPPVIAQVARARAGEIEESARPVFLKMTDYLKAERWSLCIARDQEGTATTAELPFPGEVDLAAALPVLSATSTLFIGARAWKRGSDRAACMMQARNVQQAVSGYQGVANAKDGARIPWNSIFGREGFLPAKPVCPAGGIYTFSKTIPKKGEVACKCSLHDHQPTEHADW